MFRRNVHSRLRKSNTMSKEMTTLFGYAILSLPFLFIAAGVARKMIYNVKVDAVGISFYKDTDYDSDGSSHTSYTNTYEYTYEGVTHVVLLRSESRDRTNVKCRLRINPKKPDKADGSSSLLIAAGCGLLAVMSTIYFAIR